MGNIDSVYCFQNKEGEYEKWIEDNRNHGFVFNYCLTPSLNKLHHASCSFLRRTKDEGVRTNLKKICSTNYDELLKEIDKLCNTGWSKCGHCFK